jgi:hypothetical protein
MFGVFAAVAFVSFGVGYWVCFRFDAKLVADALKGKAEVLAEVKRLEGAVKEGYTIPAADVIGFVQRVRSVI